MCNLMSNAVLDTLCLVGGTLGAMHPSTARLYEAARQLRQAVGQSNVARLLNETPQTVKNWETRGVSDSGAIKAEGVIGCRAYWLSTGEGDMLDAGSPSPKGVRPSERPRTGGLEAQNLSQPIGSDAPILMSWEDIVNGEIREEFKLAVRDEAMTPDYMPGLEIVWSTRRLPKPGRLVLVRDKHDQVHIRRHMQGREPGQWLAVPSNSAYATFDSLADGLVVLAVFKGRLEPDDA